MGYPQPFDLSGKVAVITGAGGGLGRAMALGLAEAGADVALLDIDKAGIDDGATQIGALGRGAIALACNIADEDAVDRAFAEVEARFGRIDILINNAGIGDPEPRKLHEYRTSDWRKVVSVNLDGQFYCARAALSRMVRAGSGKVINIASMWGLAGPSSVFPLPAYAATKGAIVNLTRELALEYAAQGICVNAICPGFFRTKLGPYDDAEFTAATTAFTPMGRIAAPDELKGTAIFLASAASDFITGALIPVDGGCLAK